MCGLLTLFHMTQKRNKKYTNLIAFKNLKDFLLEVRKKSTKITSNDELKKESNF